MKPCFNSISSIKRSKLKLETKACFNSSGAEMKICRKWNVLKNP